MRFSSFIDSSAPVLFCLCVMLFMLSFVEQTRSLFVSLILLPFPLLRTQYGPNIEI